jgi:hypothetical protein
MTLDDLKARPAFVVGLNDQEKAAVLAVCSNGGNKREAIKTAYNCTTEQSVTTTINRVFNRPIVKQLVDEYFDITEEAGDKDALKALLWKRINGNDPNDKNWLATANLYAEISGFKTERTPAEPPRDSESDWANRLQKIEGI